MSWTLLVTLVLALGLSLFAAVSRRAELVRMERAVRERDRAVRQGSAKAQLQHPVVDLSRCLGCGTCVVSCPEDGVLDLVHGQAMVVNGARCQGISACARECPVGAITVTLGDLRERDDVPALTEELEAIGAPGLFLAGEVTAHALVKTAIEHGAAVGAEVARRVREAASAAAATGHGVGAGSRGAADARPSGAAGAASSGAPGAGSGGAAGAESELLDLVVVGAGPAGLACSLEARRAGLAFVTLDQEATLGGTVAKYPRRKLVLTQPVDLPLAGRLERASYTKEELIDLWQRVAAEHELPIRSSETFVGLERGPDATFVVRTRTGEWRAQHVCLALGRRGTPRKLGVPGEELDKVAYALLDARSYQGRRALVVGGGDGAVETALALAEQPGNEVTLSYRKETFFRVKAANERRLDAALAEGRLRVVLRSRPVSIAPEHVDLEVVEADGPRLYRLPNDDVVVLAGGTPPLELLKRAGVSFDAAHHPLSVAPSERGSGLVRALAAGFALSLAALVFALWHHDYYALPGFERPAHVKHDLLRPSRGVGLTLGVVAVVLILANLAYLVRRSTRFRFARGSLQAWMTSHVATGILALLCAMLHGTMSPRDTAGGHAFWALVVLLASGAVGRYFYAWVPRAANGRELELAEVKARLGLMAEEWDAGQRRFREAVRGEVLGLIERQQWRRSFAGRVAGLARGQRELSRALAALAVAGHAEGVPPAELRDTLRLAKRAHRSALVAAHFEDLRAVLSAWRWVHRWVAALMVLLVVIHVVYALSYRERVSLQGLG